MGILISIVATTSALLLAEPAQNNEDSNLATIEEMVPMRDGVKLATNITPPSGKGPWPAILTRTPYGKDAKIPGQVSFRTAGYVEVVQDVRGRLKSQGIFRAFEDDCEDGYDTVEWIAKQPWSNGKVGMFGVSASGITSNMAAIAAPPHLRCAYVVVAHGSPYRFGGYPGGVLLQNLNEMWFLLLKAPLPKRPRPAIQLYDESFKRRDMRNNYAKVQIPIYNVGGWYDIFSGATVENFAGLQHKGGGKARGNQRLLMGAFGHGPLSGELKYPEDGLANHSDKAIAWFDHWLKDKPTLTGPPVKYFVMGDTRDKNAPGNQWRSAEDFPPKAKVTAFYPQSGGRLSESPSSTEDSADTFVSDPNDPVPTVGGNNLFLPIGPVDQRKLAKRTDILRYQTAPLAKPLEVVGPISAELFVSTDVEDTDFVAKLIDVYPDGYEALLVDQPFRLRFCDGFDRESKPESGKVYPITIDMWSTANVFAAGHRVALHVAGSNSPRFERHTNTWNPVASYAQAKKANNTLWHNAAYPSRLLLPVIAERTKP